LAGTVKAAQFYKLINDLVLAGWSALGLQKAKRRGSRWFTGVGDSTLLIFVETNPKYPWAVYSGGNFSINAYLPRETPIDPQTYRDDVFDSLWFFSYWDEEHVQEIHDTNRRMLEKMQNLDKDELFAAMARELDCTPTQARDADLYQTALEIMQMDVDTPGEGIVNPPLYYYDEEDVRVWANLLSRAMPDALRRITEGPRYAFGENAGP